jgi:hypothetical protein
VGSVCSRLASQLPNKVDDLHRRRTTPLAAGVAAWGDPPVILRCGVGLPAGLTATSVLSTVDDVDWFTDEQATRRVWTTFSRAANVEVSVPNSHSPGVGPVVDLAAAIKATDPTVAPPQLMDGHMHMQMPTPSP